MAKGKPFGGSSKKNAPDLFLGVAIYTEYRKIQVNEAFFLQLDSFKKVLI